MKIASWGLLKHDFDPAIVISAGDLVHVVSDKWDPRDLEDDEYEAMSDALSNPVLVDRINIHLRSIIEEVRVVAAAINAREEVVTLLADSDCEKSVIRLRESSEPGCFLGTQGEEERKAV